ncbi:MAG: DUF177 domain-containing protein [Gammaproteobacteria bacterium]
MRTAMGLWQIGSAELADLVARRATVDYSLPASALGRLVALGPVNLGKDRGKDGGQADLKVHCAFESGPEGFPQVRLTVAGTLTLVCQRCLQPLVWPVEVDGLLTVVRSDAEAAGLADPFETALLTDAGLEMAAIVEDEVLASLPLSPRHPETAACARQELMNSGETHRPLAGLADLVGRGDRQGDK